MTSQKSGFFVLPQSDRSRTFNKERGHQAVFANFSGHPLDPSQLSITSHSDIFFLLRIFCSFFFPAAEERSDYKQFRAAGVQRHPDHAVSASRQIHD